MSAAATKRIRIRSCNEVAADAIYDGRAEERARRIPRPPAVTSELACVHCSSDKTTLAMWLMLDLRSYYNNNYNNNNDDDDNNNNNNYYYVFYY